MNYLVGEWKLVSMRGNTMDGEWVEDRVFGGTSVYGPNGRVTVFFKTSEMTFGYTGRYEFRDGRVVTTIDISSNDLFEGQTIAREVVIEGPDRFRFLTEDLATSLKSESVWERVR